MRFCGCIREASPEMVREREIEAERERERELERKRTQENSTTDVTKHFTHPHPLIYTEVDYKVFQCNSCNSRGKGKRYHCAQCNFDLHKVCAQSPIIWLLRRMPREDIKRFGILHTFAHPQHPVIAEYKKKLFRCDHCNNDGDGLRYYCDACNVTFHQVCAEHPTSLTTPLHPQHELELKLRPRTKSCEQCQTKGNHKYNRIYTCKECEFYIHPECSQMPLYLLHPLHPPHPLLLKRSCGNYRCSACSEWQTYGSKYTCTRCGLDFDHNCIMQKSKIMGLNDEVRQNCTEHKITVLPAANLSFSFVLKHNPHNPPTPRNNIKVLLESASILQTLSEI